MIKLRQAIVVEGRYDKNALRQLVDAPVIETHGFGVMKDRRLLGFLRQVAAARGLIILTDSDRLYYNHREKSGVFRGRKCAAAGRRGRRRSTPRAQLSHNAA